MLRITLAVYILFISSWAWAQAPEQDGENKNQFGTVYGVHMGPLLPNQFPGMSEIMPLSGVRFGFPVRKGIVELGAAAAQAKGVGYYNASASLRGDIQLEDLHGVMFAGIDAHYYKPANEEFATAFGGHVGGGMAAHLGDLLWFRTDMKFNVNPGTALYIGFGFEWRVPGGGDAAQEENN